MTTNNNATRTVYAPWADLWVKPKPENSVKLDDMENELNSFSEVKDSPKVPDDCPF